MSGFDTVLAHAAQQSARHGVRAEGDYIGPDGLLYCGKCRTPKQFHGNFLGIERTVGCLCKCEEERQKEKKRQQDEADRAYWACKRRREAIPDSLLSGARFETARPTALIGKAQNYVKNWEMVRECNAGLLLMGGVGTGKSYAAACIVNALLDKGVSCRMISFGHILAMSFEERGQFLSRVADYGLLVLDDLGAERSTEFADETVFSVVDERYRAKRPLIVTTNLTIEQLKAPKSIEKNRVYDRLLEICGPVLCDGENQRRAAEKEKRAVLRAALQGDV